MKEKAGKDSLPVDFDTGNPGMTKYRVITVRVIGDETHARIKAAAWGRKVSLNRFCVDAIMEKLVEYESDRDAGAV